MKIHHSKPHYSVLAVLAVLASCSAGCNDSQPWDYKTPDNIPQSLCPDGQSTFNGSCVDSKRICGTSLCNENDLCVNSTCVAPENVCNNKICQADQSCIEQNGTKSCVANSRVCDNGSVCGVNQLCQENACVFEDAVCGDVTCTSDQKCIDDSASGKKCIDIKRVCDSGTVCGENENCRNEECADIKRFCEDNDTLCEADESCKNNKCIDDDAICGDVICTDLQKCVDDAEKGKSCVDEKRICEDGSVCQDTQVCQENNTCVDEDKTCKDDVCEASETCVSLTEGGDPDTCADNKRICEDDTVCAENQTCVNNECVDDEKICKDEICSGDETCFNDACEDTDKICDDKVCEDDETCVASAEGGEPDTCTETKRVCDDKTVCPENQTCKDNACVDDEKVCGDDVCEDSETCVASTEEGVPDKCVDDKRICDDENVCEEGQTCKDNACVDDKRVCDDENVCPENQTCKDNTCVDDKRVCDDENVCPENQTCKDNACVDDKRVCDDEKVCSEDETCVASSDGDALDTCVDDKRICDDEKVCEAGQTCKDNACVPDEKVCGDDVCESNETCVALSDGGTPDTCVDDKRVCDNENVCEEGQTCKDNACVPDEKVCGEEVCSNTQHCIEGACINDSDSCVNNTVVCQTGYTCYNDACVDVTLLCNDELCDEDQTCFNNACHDNSEFCGDVICAENEQCVGNPAKCVLETRICGDQICELTQACFDSGSSKSCVDPTKICGDEGSQVVCAADQECFQKACVDPDKICDTQLCTAEQECFKKLEPYQCADPSKICDDALCTNAQACVAASKVTTEEAGSRANLCVDSNRVCDNGNVCPASQTCVDNVCYNDEKICDYDICTDTQTCYDDPSDDLGRICVNTDSICDGKVCDAETQVCDNKVCKPKCFNSCIAENHEICDETTGECRELYVCEGIACKTSETCASTADYPYGECVETACTVPYEDDDPVCKPLDICYAEMTCTDPGQVCYGGTCMDDGCQGKSCDTGWQCIKGECKESACLGITCPSGRACSAGVCTDLECLAADAPVCASGTTCAKGECVYDACLDSNGYEITCKQGKVCVESGACEFEVAPTLSVTLNGSETDENGKSIAATLKIDHEPAKNITVTCEVLDNPAEVSVDCSDVLFTPANYKDAQYVTIKGLADKIADADKKYRVKFTTVSEETEFNGLTFTTDNLTNLNVDTASITPSVKSIETYEKDQNEVSFTLNFSSKPTSPVTVKVTSTKTNEGKVTVPASGSYTMTPDDWKAGIPVTIKGVDDSTQDGTQDYEIKFEVTSTDANYNGISVASVSGKNYDNDKAGLNITDRTLETDESGTIDTFSISLATEPTASVSVSLSITADNSGVDITHEAELIDPAALSTLTSFTINKDEWNVPRQIAVNGLPDLVPVIDGDQPYTITVTLDSTDTNYKLTKTIKGVNKDLDVADFVLPNMGSTNVDETGKSVTGTVLLTSKPSGTVKVKLTSADTSEVTVSPATIEFNSTNWNTPQTVTFTGVADNVVDDNKPVNVTISVTSSEDSNFTGKSTYWTITNLNKDVANITTSPSATTVKEDASGTVLVKLTSKPASPVTITPKSSSTSTMTVSPASVTLNESNWNTGVTLTVNGIHDGVANYGGSRPASLSFTVTSDDTNYKTVSVPTIPYTIVDIDSASVTITPNAATVSPVNSNTTQTTGFKVSLSTQPEKNVTVNLALKDSPTSAALGSASVTFTPSNWADISVNVSIDTTKLTTAETSYTINGSVTGSSTAYDGLSASGSFTYIALPQNASGEYASEFVVEGSGEIPEDECTVDQKLLAGTYKLEVWGASGGDGVNNDQTKKNHGGLGGYSVGYLTVTEPMNYYVHFGSAGFAGVNGKSVGGGCNAGGDGTTMNNTHVGYGGGGSSDIRLVEDTLYHRVIVAGGGGGAGTGAGGNNNGSGGVGGGTNGGYGLIDGEHYNGLGNIYYANGATQTSGYKFGPGERHEPGYYSFAAGGGGAGWFGGYAVGDLVTRRDAGGGGGSGFVLTSANKTNVIDRVNDLKNNYKLKDAKYFLTDAQTKSGSETFPSPNGGSETGHKGNGYVRITLVK